MTAAFRPITHLRDASIGVPGYGKALEFYKNLWGLQPVADDSAVTFFATPADPEQYVLRVRHRELGKLDTPGGGYGVRFFDPHGRLVEVPAGGSRRSPSGSSRNANPPPRSSATWWSTAPMCPRPRRSCV